MSHGQIQLLAYTHPPHFTQRAHPSIFRLSLSVAFFHPLLARTLSTLGDLSVNAYPLRLASGEGKDSCSERVVRWQLTINYLSHEVNALEEPESLEIVSDDEKIDQILVSLLGNDFQVDGILVRNALPQRLFKHLFYFQRKIIVRTGLLRKHSRAILQLS